MSTNINHSNAKKDILDLYYAKLNSLGITYDFLTVETSFGDTNIISTGHKNNPSLVLVHGYNSCAPIAIEALINLNHTFRIYAIDVLSQPNLSEAQRLNSSNDDCAKWLYEIISRLSIHDAYLVGMSLGGFIALKFLTYDSSRIKKAFLITPAGIVNGNPIRKLANICLPVKLYQWTQNSYFLKRFLHQWFSDQDDFDYRFQSKVMGKYKMNVSSIPLITKEAARSIHVPLYIVAAKKDILFPGTKLVNRAKSIFPSLKGTLLLEHSKHVPNALENRQIEAFIISATNEH